MGTLANLIELHEMTAGWSTLTALSLAMAIGIVGRTIMLDFAFDSWISHHIILAVVVATLLQLSLLALAVYACHALFGHGWVGLPVGALAMIILSLAWARRGRKLHARSKV